MSPGGEMYPVSSLVAGAPAELATCTMRPPRGSVVDVRSCSRR